MCQRGLSVDEYFADAKPWERPIFDHVREHIDSLGDVIVDPIEIGVLFKNGPMLCELRAKTKWTALGFSLGRRLTSDRLSRKVIDHGGKWFHVINVTEPDQIDDEILEWITEAYHFAGGTQPSSRADDTPSEGMVPDDIDDDGF